MKKITLTCPICGESFPADQGHLPSFCPRCGQPLPEDIAVEKKPFFPQEEPIPNLSTEGAKPKTCKEYAREALRWAVITVGFILILGFLYAQAAALLR